MNQIEPHDMRLHLKLNHSRLSTAEEVAQEIEDYWDATEEFWRDYKNQAEFVAPVGKGPVKGGKPNGVPYNFGKGSGTKGKGKMHEGLGFQHERGEQRKIGGYCNWCWRIGHKEAQRWFKQEYMNSNPSQDPLQRDIREFVNGQTRQRKGKVTASPRAKAKAKARARENLQEKGTTTRTRLDLLILV